MQNTILLNKGGPPKLGVYIALQTDSRPLHWGKRLSNSPRLASLSVWSILDSRALAKRIFIEIQSIPSTRSSKSRAILCQETPIDWHWNWLSSARKSSKWTFSTKSLIRAQIFTLYRAQCAVCTVCFPSNGTRCDISQNLCLDISFNIRLSQLVLSTLTRLTWQNTLVNQVFKISLYVDTYAFKC